MVELKKHCPYCGGDIEEGETVCSYCGSKLNTVAFVEIETPDKTETPDEDTPNNQNDKGPQNIYETTHEAEEQKKKSKIGRIIVLAIVVVVAIYGIVSYNNYSKRINAINAAGDFYNLVIADAPTLENIANDIQSEWYEAIWGSKYSSIDDGIKAATDKHSDEIQSIIENYSKITSLYQAASSQLGPLDDKQALNDAVKDLYSAYTDLYNAVIMFNCTYNNFCDNFNAADQKAASAVSTLYALLQQ